MEWFISFVKIWNQLPTIAFILLVGLFSKHEETFIKLLCLLCVSIMCNIILKWLFQVPLAEGINPNTYAFPSGHMQVAVVFYGGLLSHFYRHIFSAIYALLLASISFMMIYKGYHTVPEILGALIVGATILTFYHALLRLKSLKQFGGKLIYIVPLFGIIGYLQSQYVSLAYPIFYWHIFSLFLGISLALKWQFKAA